METPIDLARLIGSLVHYYLDGWRYGTLESVKKTVATIRPIGGFASGTPRCVKLHVSDIRRVE